MSLRLTALQKSNTQFQGIREKGLKEDWEDVNIVLHHQGLPFIPETIQTKIISRHYDNPLVDHFGINKTIEVVGQKYYWLSLRRDIEAYIKGCNVCLVLKAIRHKPYDDLQALLVLTHQ